MQEEEVKVGVSFVKRMHLWWIWGMHYILTGSSVHLANLTKCRQCLLTHMYAHVYMHICMHTHTHMDLKLLHLERTG